MFRNRSPEGEREREEREREEREIHSSGDTGSNFLIVLFHLYNILTFRAGHNFRCPLISPLSVDPLINGTALIFHCGNVNLTEERLYLNLFMAKALKILFCLIF